MNKKVFAMLFAVLTGFGASGITSTIPPDPGETAKKSAAKTAAQKTAEKKSVQTVKKAEAKPAVRKTAEKQEEKELSEIMRPAYPADKLKKIRTVKFVFEVTGKGITPSYLVIRAKKNDKVRMDIIDVKEAYTVCRNGKDFWGYEQEKFFTLKQAEAMEMAKDLAFLPLPFVKAHAYELLKRTGTGYYRSAKCDIYQTQTKGNSSEKISIWIDSETKLFRVVKQTNHEGQFASSFNNFQDFDGIKFASLINLSSPKGVITMNLVSFDRDQELADSVFARKDPLKDSSLMLLRRNLEKRAPEFRRAQEKKAADQAEAAKKEADKKIASQKKRQADSAERERRMEIALTKEVRDLTIKINAKQKRLDELSKIINEDRKGAYDAASKSSSGFRYRSTTYYDCWGGVHRSSDRKNQRQQKHLARELQKEVEAASKEYDKISRELTDMQIQLGDAQAALKKIQDKKRK